MNRVDWCLNTDVNLKDAEAALATLPASDLTYAGRGKIAVYFCGEVSWIVRRYHRGGFMRHFLKQYYLYLGLHFSRPWQEFTILEMAEGLGLPVPHPIAAYLRHRAAFFYEAALITQEIPQSRTLSQFLMEADLSEIQWLDLFALIDRFHDLGFYHADLNAHNILINEAGEFYLIDFDKAKMLKMTPRLRLENKKRLLRSCLKLKKQNPEWHFSEEANLSMRQWLLRT